MAEAALAAKDGAGGTGPDAKRVGRRLPLKSGKVKSRRLMIARQNINPHRPGRQAVNAAGQGKLLGQLSQLLALGMHGKALKRIGKK